MKIGYLVLGLLLVGCAARNFESPSHPIVAEYRRLHALTKEFRREAEECFNRPDIPQPTNATERKYRDDARKIMIRELIAGWERRETKEEIDERMLISFGLLVDSAPQYEREVAVDAIITVRRGLPMMVCTVTLIRKENSLHKQLDQARENALLASARAQLSSRDMAEIGVFHKLINEELDAFAKQLKEY